MAEDGKYAYNPDYLVPPGKILDDYLESLNMTQAELALRTGLARKTINEIIKGKAPITPETALKFERTLGRPSHFWLNLQLQYQEDSVRLAERARMNSHLEWLERVPVKDMVKLRWITPFDNKLSQLEEVLRFFGVASPEQWNDIWESYQVAYRQTKRYEVHAEAISAWLRRGEIEAQTRNCRDFDGEEFKSALHRARALTREHPKVFVPAIQSLCADAGVAVLFVPELPKTGVCGATQWVGKKAIIQLSLRYKSNDHLWFTFFHEAGHILKHGRKMVFIEGNGMDGEKEEEANAFARDMLIPPSKLNDFISSWDRRTLGSIEDFAIEIGIAPGIIVGRLQHDKILQQSHGNKLKIYFCWKD